MNRKKFAKVMAKVKRFSDFYLGFQIKNLYIADNHRLFLVPKEGFCEYCFKRRYLTQFNREPMAEISERIFERACDLDKKYKGSSSWRMFSIDTGELQATFDVYSYESCPQCFQAKDIPKDQVKELYDKLLGQETVPKLEELRKQLFSFGFASTFFSDNKIGFVNKEFEKILGANYYARVVYKMLTFQDHVVEASTLGISEDKELAATKSIMEYIERYSLTQQLAPLKTLEFDDKIIHDFLSLYKFSMPDAELSRLRESALWGVNLHSGNVHPIPLRFIYNKGDINYLKPSSSGFAAHIDFKRSLVSSILELVERDAFVRFWHEPLRAYNYTPDQQIQSEIDNMISVLKIILGNENITSNGFVVKSPTKLPVAMLTISSTDFTKSPSLNFGFGTGFSLSQAMDSALDELRVNVSNLIQGCSSIPGFLNKTFQGKIEDIPSRMNYYATSIPRSKLGFLDMENHMVSDIYEDANNDDLSDLLERFSQYGLEIYGVDVTPECFKDKNVYVTRAFSTNLYPLQFIDEDVFNLPTGQFSARNLLPHFFI